MTEPGSLSQGVVSLVMPKTGLTLTLMSGTLLARGVLETCTTSNPVPSSKRAIAPIKCKDSDSKSPAQPSSPGRVPRVCRSPSPQCSRSQSPRAVRSNSPPQRLDIDDAPAHSVDRNRQYMERCLARNLDINYMSHLKNCFDKLKSKYSPTCEDVSECPLLQTRLEKHKNQAHPADPGQEQNSALASRDPQNTGPSQLKLTTSKLGRIVVQPTSRRDLPANRNKKIKSSHPTYQNHGIHDFNRQSRSILTRPEKSDQLSNYNQTKRRSLSAKTRADQLSNNNHRRNHNTSRQSRYSMPIRHQYSNTPPNNATYTNQYSNTQENEDDMNDNFEHKSYTTRDSTNPTDNDQYNRMVQYKYDLQDQVADWLSSAPCYPTSNPDDLQVQENAINELVENIHNFNTQKDTQDYEKQVELEINKCLDSLNLWFPMDQRENIKFKRDLSNKLFRKILEVNKNLMQDQMHLNNAPNKPAGNTTKFCSTLAHSGSNKCTLKSSDICSCEEKKRGPSSSKKIKCDRICGSCNNAVENEISDWLNRVHLQKLNGTGPLSKRLLLDTLMQRLAPYFEKSSSENNIVSLKEDIIDILNELSIGTSKKGDRKQYINQFAYDLANRLIGIHARIEGTGSLGKKSWNKNINAFVVQGEPFDFSEKKMCLAVSENLKQKLFEEVQHYLASTSLKEDKHLEKDIVGEINAISKCKDEKSNAQISSLPRSSYLNKCDCFILGSSTQRLKPIHGDTVDTHNKTRSSLFIDKSADTLKNKIHDWMQPYPSQMFKERDKNMQEVNAYDLADKIHKRLIANHNSDKIQLEVAKWLLKVVIPEETSNVITLTNNIITKLKSHSNRDLLILASGEDTKNSRKINSKSDLVNATTSKISMSGAFTSQATNTEHIYLDADHSQNNENIMIQYISKYIKHIRDVKDTIAKAAFAQLLKNEVYKINSATRKIIYNNFTETKDMYSLKHLDIELQFIKDVSDWLKNLPIESSYSLTDNRKQVTLVLSLAKSLFESEVRSTFTKQTVDYDKYIREIICRLVSTLPIIPDQKENMDLVTDQLVSKLLTRRPYVELALVNKHFSNPPSMTEFIGCYFQSDLKEVTDNDLKLEAWSARIIKEVKKIIYVSNPKAFTKTQVYDRLANQNILSRDDKVKHFNLRLDYVSETSDWLRNLHLIYNNERTIVEAIVELVEKMTDVTATINSITNDAKSISKSEDYILQWIDRLPLDSRYDIFKPIAVKQLINRIEAVNIRHYNKNTEQLPSYSKTREPNPLAKFKKRISQINLPFSQGDLSSFAKDTVEKWCNSLSVEINDMRDDEKDVKIAKDRIARKLFQRLEELNEDPHFNLDNLLYRDAIAMALDQAISYIPRNIKLQVTKEDRERFLKEIVEAKKSVVQPTDQTYLERLEQALDVLLPIPIQAPLNEDPCFEIYKNRLATMFILDNFDRGDEEKKLVYEKRIKEEIDTYFPSAQQRNVFPLDKDKMYNELYRTLYNVPTPHEDSIANELQEIKIRCEAVIWFDSLPLKPCHDMEEFLGRDQILTTIAKRINQIQKHEKNPQERVIKEIQKCLMKLPFLMGQETNIDDLAVSLQTRLRAHTNQWGNTKECSNYNLNTIKLNQRRESGSDKEIRTLSQNEVNNTNTKDATSPSISSRIFLCNKPCIDTQLIESPNSSVFLSDNSTQSIGPGYVRESTKKTVKSNENSSFAQSRNMDSHNNDSRNESRRNGISEAKLCQNDNRADDNNKSTTSIQILSNILLRKIEVLCDQIPFPTKTVQEQRKVEKIKYDLVTSILTKVDELNGDTKVLNDDTLYEYLLNIELEKILLSTLPQNLAVDKREIRKNLIAEIISVKLLLVRNKEPKAFKKDLFDVLDKVIGRPKHPKHNFIFRKAQEFIICDFLQYQYNKGNEESKLFFKRKVCNSLKSYAAAIKDSKLDQETLIRCNILISELEKVSPPNSYVLRNEIIEIRMRNQISKLFEDIFRNPSLDKKIELGKIKTSLGKRLVLIEMAGYSTENEKIMGDEITKTLEQLGVKASQDQIKEFINNLKETEIVRTAYPGSSKNLLEQQTLEYLSVPEIQSPYNRRDSRPQRPPKANRNTQESGLGTGSQTSNPDCSECCSAIVNTSFQDPRSIHEISTLFNSTMEPQGRQALGPDYTPGSLPDTTYGSDSIHSRPAWQYASAYRPGGSRTPGSLLDSTDSGSYLQSSRQQMQPFEYVSGYGPDGLMPGSLPSSSFSSSPPNSQLYMSGYGPGGLRMVDSLPNSTFQSNLERSLPYNAIGSRVQPFEYRSSFSPSGQLTVDSLPNSIFHNPCCIQKGSQTLPEASRNPCCIPKGSQTLPEVNNPSQTGYPRRNLQTQTFDSNQQYENSFGVTRYQPYPYTSPSANISPINSNLRYSFMPDSNHDSTSYLSLPSDSLGPATINFQQSNFMPSRNIPDSTLHNYSNNYNSILSSNFRPPNQMCMQRSQNIPEMSMMQDYVQFSPMVSVRPYQLYKRTLPSVDISSLQSNPPNQMYVQRYQNITLPEMSMMQDSVQFSPIVSVRPYQPYEGTLLSADISPVPSNYQASLQTISPIQQGQSFQPRPGRCGVNCGSSVDRVDTWNSSDSGAELLIQQVSARVNQNQQTPIAIAPSYNGPLGLRDYESALKNPQYQGQQLTPCFVAGGSQNVELPAQFMSSNPLIGPTRMSVDPSYSNKISAGHFNDGLTISETMYESPLRPGGSGGSNGRHPERQYRSGVDDNEGSSRMPIRCPFYRRGRGPFNSRCPFLP